MLNKEPHQLQECTKQINKKNKQPKLMITKQFNSKILIIRNRKNQPREQEPLEVQGLVVSKSKKRKTNPHMSKVDYWINTGQT